MFRNKSRYCVIIVSKDYVERDRTNHERQSAVARGIRERGKEYILPVKLDDGIELAGVADTIATLISVSLRSRRGRTARREARRADDDVEQGCVHRAKMQRARNDGSVTLTCVHGSAVFRQKVMMHSLLFVACKRCSQTLKHLPRQPTSAVHV